MEDITQAVAFIHEKHEIHRDLKPSKGLYPYKHGLNPLVLYSLANEAWKVADFAFTMEGSSRRAYTTVYARGTRGYRVPELIRPSQSKYTNKVDLWAIGCILYELVLRRRVFEDDWEILQYATSGKHFEIIIEPETVPDNGRREFISNIIRELLSIGPTQRPRADVLYKRFISWGSDISASQTDRTIGLVQTTTSVFDMTIPSTSVLDLPTFYAAHPNPSQSHNLIPSHVRSSITIIDHSPSPVDHAVPTIVTQGSERGHLAADNSPVASRRAHPAPKRANRAQIKRYNEQLFVAAKTGNVADMRRLLGAGADIESKDTIFGLTPLSLAAFYGRHEVVEFLVREGGADVESKDKEGRTALDRARRGIREGWGIGNGAGPWWRGWRSKKSKHAEKPAHEGGWWEHESRIQGKRKGTSLMSHHISYFIFHVFIFRMFIYHGFVQSYCCEF